MKDQETIIKEAKLTLDTVNCIEDSLLSGMAENNIQNMSQEDLKFFFSCFRNGMNQGLKENGI
jgi:hypothetical protein